MEPKLSWAVLGPLEVRDESGPIPLGGSTIRALVALLLAGGGRVVASSVLMDAIWPDHPVRSTGSSLHVAVSRLRNMLGPHGGCVESPAGGYRLSLEGAEVDATQAAKLQADGQQCLTDGDPQTAAQLFDDALDLWRGPPLVGLTSYAFHPELTRTWVDLRLDLLEARNDAYLACGRHPEVAVLAAADAAAQPWRERFRCQQVLALYRCARQAEALSALDEHRRRLAEDLGISPCPALADLHVRILRQDEALLDPRRTLTPDGFVV